MAGECPGMGRRRFGNIGVELPPSDPLSLILSSHDREHPALVSHYAWMSFIALCFFRLTHLASL